MSAVLLCFLIGINCSWARLGRRIKMTSDNTAWTEEQEKEKKAGNLPAYDPTVDYGALCEVLRKANEEAEKKVQDLMEEFRCLRTRLRFFETALRKKPKRTRKRHCRLCETPPGGAHKDLPATRR